MPVLTKTLRRWKSMVRGLRNNLAATSRLERPSATNRATCPSCAVRLAAVDASRLWADSPEARSSWWARWAQGRHRRPRRSKAPPEGARGRRRGGGRGAGTRRRPGGCGRLRRDGRPLPDVGAPPGNGPPPRHRPTQGPGRTRRRPARAAWGPRRRTGRVRPTRRPRAAGPRRASSRS